PFRVQRSRARRDICHNASHTLHEGSLRLENLSLYCCILAEGFTIWQAISHNWALTSIACTLLILFIVPTLIAQKYVNICLNILRDTEPPLSRTQVGFVPLRGEERTFFAEDGLCLRGTLIRCGSRKPRGLILFAPEFKSDRQSCARY